MEEILEQITRASEQLEADGSANPVARAAARALLARAREMWPELGRQERVRLGGPAAELRGLLEASEHAGPAPAPEELLARFGLSRFRAGQREAVEAALAGRDALVVMPTGGGKSLCYQLPALAGRGLVVVVSPLIALMSDQLRRLREADVAAVMIASGLEEGANARALGDIATGAAQLALVAPERFASRAFREALGRARIALFVVDEAHCVAEWGHDFRPDYLRLQSAIAALGRPPVMATTATATPKVAAEIARRLGLRDWVSIRSGFDRPNLSFDVIAVEGKGAMRRKRGLLLGALARTDSRPAIVYCGTRRDSEEIAGLLAGEGIAAVSYHAGMAPEARTESQAAFMEGRAEVVVATNAFGMGVDKADVRSVIHWAIPTSLEAYYQEAGRAGRDGRPAQALLLAARADLGRLIRFITARETSVADVRAYLGRLGDRSERGELECERPGEEERILLSIAERSGAVRLRPGAGGMLSLSLTGHFDRAAAEGAIRAARNRGWEAYRTIERFVANGSTCRRRQILDHFGDPSPGRPDGRCCDVCDSGFEPIEIRPTGPPARSAQRSGTRRAPGAGPSEGVDEQGFERLRVWRQERAEGKPAYTVASNAVLEEVLRRGPADVEELLAIKGIGPAFASRHGDSLLELLGSLAAA